MRKQTVFQIEQVKKQYELSVARGDKNHQRLIRQANPDLKEDFDLLDRITLKQGY